MSPIRLRRLLSRRAFLAYAASATVAALAACSGPEKGRSDDPYRLRPTADRESGNDALGVVANAQGATSSEPASPTTTNGSVDRSRGVSTTPTETAETTGPVTVSIDPAITGLLRSRASAIQERIVATIGATTVESGGDIVIAMAADGGAADGQTTPIDYAAVVSRKLLVRDVSFANLRALWNGAIDDWSAVGSPVPHGVIRVTVDGSAGPMLADGADRAVASLDELATLMYSDRGALAFIPLDQIDFRFRTLNVDGVDPIRPEGAVSPLRSWLQIRASSAVQETVAASLDSTLVPAMDGPTPVSMTWAGDIIIAREVHRRILETGDWAAPFRSIYPELIRADLTISNLETSLSDAFETIIYRPNYTFKTDTASIEGLKLAQIDILSRANNHSFNYGVQGMDDTTAVLDAAGILHYGMGHNLEEARSAVVVERGGTTYAFLGYNGISDDVDGAGPDWAGTMPLTEEYVIEDIQRELAAGHVVIPFFHWGIEYVYDPSEEQRYFAHLAIDQGASLVMGSHPHWVQAVETYRNVPIVYSLGNFIFDQEWSLETKQGMMAHVWMQGSKVLKLDLAPILIEDFHKPRLMTPDEQWALLENVWAASDWIVDNG